MSPGRALTGVGMGVSGKRSRWQELAVEVGAEHSDFLELILHIDNQDTDTQVGPKLHHHLLLVCPLPSALSMVAMRFVEYRYGTLYGGMYGT